jgi:hypothetical protein
MSCGSLRTVISHTTVAQHLDSSTEQLHRSVRRDSVRWQSLMVWQCLSGFCDCSAPESHAAMLCASIILRFVLRLLWNGENWKITTLLFQTRWRVELIVRF